MYKLEKFKINEINEANTFISENFVNDSVCSELSKVWIITNNNFDSLFSTHLNLELLYLVVINFWYNNKRLIDTLKFLITRSNT